MLGSAGILWVAFVFGLLTVVYAVRMALRWRDWRLTIPLLGIFAIVTGPVMEIVRHLGLLSADVAHALVDYRWLAVSIIALLAVITMERFVEHERRLRRDIATGEERFRSISRVLPVGVFQADVDGRCSYANDVSLSMIGIGIGDAVGEGWMRRLHPDDRDRVMEEWQAAALEGRDFRSEYRFRTSDGETIWVLGHVLAVKDEDGDVISHVGAIVDITDRKNSELALEEARATLERRVIDRTAELVRANEDLAREIASRRRAEAALLESESRLRSILDNTPAHIWIKGLDGRYLYLNAPAPFTEDRSWLTNFVGKTDDEAMSAEVAAVLLAADREAIESGGPVECEVSIPGSRGNRTYLAVKFPLRDKNEEIYAIAGVATDITRRAQATEAVRRVFALAPAMMCTLDADGNFVMVNPGFTRALGYAEDELIGRNFAEFVHPDDLAGTREQWLKQRASGEIVTGFGNRYRSKTGAYRFLSWHLAFAADEATFYGAATDITEKERQNESIRRIYQLSPVIMCTFDLDGYYRAINPVLPRTLGFTEEEILGHHYHEFLHPGDRDAAIANERLLMTGEATISGFETRNRCKDGSYRILSWDLSSSPADNTVYGIARDVTKLRQSEQELTIRREEMAHLLRLQTMGEMASEMAHELNQPLSAIVNYAKGAGNRVRSHTASEGELLELMDKISAQALRAGDLIRKMRTFAKRAEIEIEECSINDLVHSAMMLLGAGGKLRTPITLILDPALPQVHVDSTQIEQVILNLARNGLDAIEGKEGGGLRIQTERIGASEIRLTVADNGPGLALEDREKIFEPFYTTKPSGLGLGLPISRSIVQAHGGRLWAESIPGTGTMFRIVLPVDEQADA
jgi:two-component system sensor kinase FixL